MFGCHMNYEKKILLTEFAIWEMLLKHNESKPFLKRNNTDDKKWVKYENIKRKLS